MHDASLKYTGLPTPFNLRPQKATKFPCFVHGTGRGTTFHQKNTTDSVAQTLEHHRRTVLTHVRLVPPWMVLVLAAAAAGDAAAAPRLVCYPIIPGETMTSISVRLTRNPQSWRAARFQILDPAAARFVPKSEYRRLQGGWQACVVDDERVPQVVPRRGWWLLVFLSAATLTTWAAVQVWIERRKAVSQVLETFGAAFICEFERPLVDPRCSRSVLRGQLVLSPDKRSLEVLLAPTEGRRYPNLSDHRANVEYDVERVVNVLNDRRFVCGPLSARGRWVTIPCRLTDVRKEGGA